MVGSTLITCIIISASLPALVGTATSTLMSSVWCDAGTGMLELAPGLAPTETTTVYNLKYSPIRASWASTLVAEGTTIRSEEYVPLQESSRSSDTVFFAKSAIFCSVLAPGASLEPGSVRDGVLDESSAGFSGDGEGCGAGCGEASGEASALTQFIAQEFDMPCALRSWISGCWPREGNAPSASASANTVSHALMPAVRLPNMAGLRSSLASKKHKAPSKGLLHTTREKKNKGGARSAARAEPPNRCTARSIGSLLAES